MWNALHYIFAIVVTVVAVVCAIVVVAAFTLHWSAIDKAYAIGNLAIASVITGMTWSDIKEKW